MTLTKKEVNFIKEDKILRNNVEKLNNIRNKLMQRYNDSGAKRFRILLYDKRAPYALDVISDALDSGDNSILDDYTTITISPWFVAGVIGVLIFVVMALSAGRDRDLFWWVLAMISGTVAISFTIAMCDEWSIYEG
jgi:hypothetical protein